MSFRGAFTPKNYHQVTTVVEDHLNFTHKTKTVMDVHLPSPGWSPNIPRMVKHHPLDGHSPSKGIVAHHPKHDHLVAVKWLPTMPGMVITFPRTVTHHFQDGQLDLEFDSSVAQLV